MSIADVNVVSVDVSFSVSVISERWLSVSKSSIGSNIKGEIHQI